MTAENCKQRIQEAYLNLLSDKPSFTISQIIEAANVSRPTYYRYYYNQQDILEDIIEGFISRLAASTSQIEAPDFVPDTNRQHEAFTYQELQCYRNNAELLRRLCMNSTASSLLRARLYRHFSDCFDSWMRTSNEKYGVRMAYAQVDYELYRRFSFAGCYDVIITWVLNDCQTSCDVLLDFLLNMARGATRLYQLGKK